MSVSPLQCPLLSDKQTETKQRISSTVVAVVDPILFFFPSSRFCFLLACQAILYSCSVPANTAHTERHGYEPYSTYYICVRCIKCDLTENYSAASFKNESVRSTRRTLRQAGYWRNVRSAMLRLFPFPTRVYVCLYIRIHTYTSFLCFVSRPSTKLSAEKGRPFVCEWLLMNSRQVYM